MSTIIFLNGADVVIFQFSIILCVCVGSVDLNLFTSSCLLFAYSRGLDESFWFRLCVVSFLFFFSSWLYTVNVSRFSILALLGWMLLLYSANDEAMMKQKIALHSWSLFVWFVQSQNPICITRLLLFHYKKLVLALVVHCFLRSFEYFIHNRLIVLDTQQRDKEL